MNYRRNLFYIVSFFFISISSLSANAYEWEARLYYSTFETDDNFEEEEFVALRATRYLTPVSTVKGPLAESAYLSHTSSLNFGYGNFSVKQQGIGDFDGPEFEWGALYVVPESGYLFGVNYADSSIEDGPGKTDQSNLDLQIGKYFTDTFSGYLAYSDVNVDTPPALADIDATSITVGVKNILKRNGKYINLEGLIQRVTEEISTMSGDKTNTIVSLAGDYYLTPQVGLGALAKINTGDTSRNEGTTYGINASYFFNPQYALMATYETFSADNAAGRDANRAQLNFAVRF